MIDVIFEFAGTYIMVRVEGTRVTFANTMYGAQMATIDGLKLNEAGTIKEFPDLKDNPSWREIAIERFKDKIKSLENEDERIDYIVKDLSEHGYIPKFKQKAGFRKVIL